LKPVLGFVALAIFFFYFLSFFVALPSELVNKELWHATLKIPKAIWVMMGTVFHIKKANKTFIHTVHTKTEVSNTLFNDHVN